MKLNKDTRSLLGNGYNVASELHKIPRHIAVALAAAAVILLAGWML